MSTFLKGICQAFGDRIISDSLSFGDLDRPPGVGAYRSFRWLNIRRRNASEIKDIIAWVVNFNVEKIDDIIGKE